MDPAYGDDLWAGGFSSEEEDDNGEKKSNEDLDLLASLVEERGGGEGEGGRERGESRETFEEALTKPDDVSLMKAKMEAMEKELLKLRQQVAESSPTSHTHQNRPHPQSQAVPKKSPPISKKTSSVAKATKPAKTAQRAEGLSESGAAVGERGVAEKAVVQRKADREHDIVTDVFSGLRIKNPLVSSELMKKRMQGRKMIKIPNISSRVRGSDIVGDWVTVGVVVDKMPPRDSAKGNKYAVWKLSDLSSQSAVVSLFLFGKAYQEHWKMVQSSVVALLNPTVMPNRETGTVDTSSKQLALSLDNPQRLMPLGISQEFTVCRATTRAGRKCTNFAKASDGGHCDYHIQGAYKKIRTGRMDCQGGYGPSTANIRGKLFKDSKTDIFYYGGKSYTSGGGGVSSGRGAGGEEGGGQDKRLFAQGARESLMEISQEVAGRRSERSAGAVRPGKTVITSDGGAIFQEMLNSQRPGAMLLNRHHQNEKEKKQQAAKPAEKSASELLLDEGVRDVGERKEGVAGSRSSVSPFQPTLGRGLAPGSVVDFTSGQNPAQLKTRLAAVKKLKAAAVLRKKEKRDTGTDDILHRVEENREKDATPFTPEEQNEEEGDKEEGPLKKRRKLDSDEIDKILNAKSSHNWEAREAEWEREEQYFALREKKENMEEKLGSIRELNVYVSQCKQCGYVAEHASDMCQKEGHSLSRFKAVKRCFECQECCERAHTYNARYPPFSCRKCGSKSFKQTSFFREQKGPKIGGENLLLRGREEKFLH